VKSKERKKEIYANFSFCWKRSEFLFWVRRLHVSAKTQVRLEMSVLKRHGRLRKAWKAHLNSTP
jgi:hypothetical protein